MSEIKPNTATYKGFAVVIQQDNKKKASQPSILVV